MYNPTCVIKTSTCLSRSILPSYRSRVRPFHPRGSSTFITPSSKRMILRSFWTCWGLISRICLWPFPFEYSPPHQLFVLPLLWNVCLNCYRIIWFSSLSALTYSSLFLLTSANCRSSSHNSAMFSSILLCSPPASYLSLFTIFLIDTIGSSKYTSGPQCAPNFLVYD